MIAAHLSPVHQLDQFCADQILAERRRRGRAVVIGLSGAQGIGKSTLAGRIAARLEAAGETAVTLSLDDFYLGRQARRRLAEQIHPLLATRGAPGTHDVSLALDTLQRLLHAGSGDRVRLPRFDKLSDDRMPPEAWPEHSGPVSVVILEGWCLGVRPQPATLLEAPVNALERIDDAQGLWRRHVNDQLEGAYASLFARLDLILMLRAPSFEAVLGWRTEQEIALARESGRPGAAMTPEALKRFVSHYERLTRWMLDQEPADVVIALDGRRAPLGWRPGALRPPPGSPAADQG